MGEIKSALELALERTAGIKSDPDALRAKEAKDRGKRLFARLREESTFDVVRAIKAEERDERDWVKEGFFDVLLANLTLPSSRNELDTLDLVMNALPAVIRDQGTIKTLGAQIRQFFEQYLGDREQLIEGLRAQFEPRLREREQALAQQYGRPVRIDPASDPEFAKVLQENLGSLQARYREAFAQVHEQLRTMYERNV